MLIYVNTILLYQKNIDIIIEESDKIFTEQFDAEIDIETYPEDVVFTLKIIIDEPIHEPLNERQFNAVYTADFITKFDERIDKIKFKRKVQNIHNSKTIFKSQKVIDDIYNIGFSGVYYFVNGRRRIRLVKPVIGNIIDVIS
jgi:hypothetical protein